MFENIILNFKTKSSKITDSISIESLKDKTSKLSESFFSIGHNFMHKTNSLSYFSNNQSNKKSSPSKKSSFSTPNLMNNKENQMKNGFVRQPSLSNRDYVQFNPIADYDEIEDDNIVDKFERVVNVDEERQSLSVRYSFRRRNDREEIRRRLATGDADDYYGGDRPGRKPSLQTRLQSGMNLQICFMNDTMSDTESPSSEAETPVKAVSPAKHPSPLAAITHSKPPPSSLPTNGNVQSGLGPPLTELQTEADLCAYQARLQTEARLALAQAKDLARLQMEGERHRRQISPITEMLRNTLQKVGVVFPHDRRRVSRQMLTDMNVAQLQVIVNDLHTQIEYLNESLVKFLMERDDLHMSQDSMLVDIEDLTRYLGAKENTFKEDITFNNNVPLINPQPKRVPGMIRK